MLAQIGEKKISCVALLWQAMEGKKGKWQIKMYIKENVMFTLPVVKVCGLDWLNLSLEIYSQVFLSIKYFFSRGTTGKLNNSSMFRTIIWGILNIIGSHSLNSRNTLSPLQQDKTNPLPYPKHHFPDASFGNCSPTNIHTPWHQGLLRNAKNFGQYSIENENKENVRWLIWSHVTSYGDIFLHDCTVL